MDYNWSKIEWIKDGMGHTKYPTILSVVKAVHTSAHANVDVKRKLSDNSKIVAVYDQS